MNEAQRFANLVCELRTLLDNYFKVTEDMKSDPLTYYALFNLYLSIQVIDQYAIHDSVAIEFLKSLSDRHKEDLGNLQKDIVLLYTPLIYPVAFTDMDMVFLKLSLMNDRGRELPTYRY